MQKNFNNKNYIYSFDGLRSIAVTLVILYHLSPHVFSGGYLGVVIFLCMSGYLVTDNFLKELKRERKIDIIKFWKKRLIKLYIPLLPMLSIVSIIMLFLFDDMLKGYVGNLFSTLFGLNNIYQIMNGLSYFEAHGNLNPFTHLWSLGLEIQFYFIWPIILSLLYSVFKLKKKKLSISIFILSFISATIMFLLYTPNVDVSRIYYGPDTRAFGFLVGAIFAVLFPREEVLEKDFKYSENIIIDVFTVILFFVILYISIFFAPTNPWVYRYGMYIYSFLISILMILILLKDNIINKLLSLKAFTIVGRRSYSLYLWQYPVMIFISSEFAWTKISKISLFFIELIISILIAEISYRIFENKKNYLRYIQKDDKIIDRNKAFAILALAIFVIFATSLTSLTKKQNDIDILKNKIEEMSDNQKNLNNLEIIEKPSEDNTDEITNDDSQIDKAENKSITFIGDSVMLCAIENIKDTFHNSHVDAKVSRQAWDLHDVLDNLRSNDLIKEVVVIHLGTNYKINKSKFIDNLKSLGDRPIFLVNCIMPEAWEEQVNTTLSEISKEMDNVNLIDWYGFAKGKKELFYKDATHPNEKGAKEYNKLLETEIKKVLNK